MIQTACRGAAIFAPEQYMGFCPRVCKAAFVRRIEMENFLLIKDLGLVFFMAASAHFALRYFALEHALRETALELTEIQGCVLQNRILRLPLPDKGLERLLKSINGALEQIRRERLRHERREREFQQQIEDISHDLRTPLTVILGYLKWLKAPAGSASFRLEESLDVLERNARSMEHLVSQFYAFSRVNGRDFSLEPERLDVCRLLRECLADNYGSLEREGFSLEGHLPEHPVTALGNRDACERIFANMLQNAGRYAHSYLDIRILEDCGQVQILFQNDSLEIKEGDIPNLFNRFYRNDATRKKGSSGLGLTIARSLAEAMGGSLTAQALPAAKDPADRGNGCHGQTVVCFVLTLVKGTASAPPPFPPPQADSRTEDCPPESGPTASDPPHSGPSVHTAP